MKTVYVEPYEKIPFFGLFFIIDFNKSFNGHTLVLPEKSMRKLEWVATSGRKPVKLDDPEFENIFSVFGTDQIAARYVLSNSLMKRIVDYSKKVKRPISISFINDKLYVAIDHKKDKFDLKLNRSVYDFNRVKEFYQDLKIGIDIIEDLNLNTRIWLKKDNNEKLEVEIPRSYKPRKKWIFNLLFYTLGMFGAHLFYVGYIKKGIYKLLIGTPFISLIIWLLFQIQINWQNLVGEGDEIVVFVYSLMLGMFAFVFYAVSLNQKRRINRDSRGHPLK